MPSIVQTVLWTYWIQETMGDGVSKADRKKKHVIERHIIGKIVSCVLTKAPRVFLFGHFRTIVDIHFNRFHTVLLTRYAIVLTNSDRIH